MIVSRLRQVPKRPPSRGFSSLAARLASNKSHDTAGRHDGFARRRPPPQSNPPSLPPQSSQNQGPNTLLSPVHIPEDNHGILRPDHPATSILANSSVVIQRQLEMMNVLMGFEQANRYVIMDPQGNHIGYLAEQEHGLGNAIARQTFRTHRSFTTHVFDKNEQEILRFHRPFSWISSRIRVYDALAPSSSYSPSNALDSTRAGLPNENTPSRNSDLPLSEMRVIGEAQQEWAPLRRKYNLFLHRDLANESPSPDNPQLAAGNLPLSSSKALRQADPSEAQLGFAQFASVDEPFLSWDFSLKAADGQLIGSVNRNFAGFARELFTDTGVYALRMDSAGLSDEPGHWISRTARDAQGNPSEGPTGMTLDQRAVMLATAVSVDFDYFSRLSRPGGGWLPLWFPVPFGGAGGEAGAAGAAGAAGGAAESGGLTEAGGSAVGAAGRAGAAESGVAGAGSVGAYEAMQRGSQGSQPGEEVWGHGADPHSPQPGSQESGGSFWGDDWPPKGPPPSGDGGGSSGGGEGGGGFDWTDIFGE